MKELKEKSFTVYVTLNDDSNVQTMLENLYNELYQTDITRA